MQQQNVLTLVNNENIPYQPIEYFPQSLKTAINNRIVEELKLLKKERLICLKGIYKKTGNKPSSGYYYDSITNSGASFKIKIDEGLRKLLTSDTFYRFEGFYEYEQYYNDFHFFVEKEISPNEAPHSKISEINSHINVIHNQYRHLNSLHREREKNKKTLKDLVEQKLRKKEKLLIALIGANENKVFKDIQSNLSNQTMEHMMLHTEYIRYTKEDILKKVSNFCEAGCEAICIARGGGRDDDFNMFDDADFIEKLLTIGRDCLIMSAVGHDSNIPFIENFADEYFSTATALANEINKCMEEALLEQKYEKTQYENITKIGRQEQMIIDINLKFKEQEELLDKITVENNTLKEKANEPSLENSNLKEKVNELLLENNTLKNKVNELLSELNILALKINNPTADKEKIHNKNIKLKPSLIVVSIITFILFIEIMKQFF